MIVENIRYKLIEAQRASFESDYAKAAESLDASEWCKGYELTRCEEEPDRYMLRILWTTTVDHMKKFRGSAEFRTFLPHIRPYVGAIEEMQHYTVTDVVSG